MPLQSVECILSKLTAWTNNRYKTKCALIAANYQRRKELKLSADIITPSEPDCKMF